MTSELKTKQADIDDRDLETAHLLLAGLTTAGAKVVHLKNIKAACKGVMATITTNSRAPMDGAR